jgi:hypothetical protein
MKNEEKAKQDFDDRVKAAKRKAIEDNIAKAKASREQTDADHRRAGQSGVRNTINYEEREVADEDEANKVKLKEVREVEELK